MAHTLHDLPNGEVLTVQLICLIIIASVAAGAALHWLANVLVPLVFAIAIAACLSPAVDAAELAGIHRYIGTSICIALVVGVLYSLVHVLGNATIQVAKNMENMAMYTSTFTATARDVKDKAKALENTPFGFVLNNQFVEARIAELSLGTTALGATQSLLSALALGMSNLLLIIVFVAFILEMQLVSKHTFASKIHLRFRGYVGIKMCMSLLCGVLTFIFYHAVGLELALAFGSMHFILTWIPSIGPLVAVLLPLPVAFMDTTMTTFTRFSIFLAPTIIHGVVGIIIEPKLLGDNLELHSLTVLAALVVWGAVWGMPGVLLAAPLTAAIKLMFESMPATRPLAAVMGAV
jgi:AI-2 transport protein TqsA